MMMAFWMLLWGPLLVAGLVALTIHLVTRRTPDRLPGRLIVVCAIAGGIPTLLIGGMPAVTFQLGAIPLDLGTRATMPLLLGVFAVILLMLTAPRARASATADLTPRRVSTFTSRGWFIAVAALSAAVVALTVAAGLASQMDDEGRYTMYRVSIDGGITEIGTRIYGWFYSTGSLITLAALLVATAIAWWLIARPAWGDDVEQDAALRRLRSDSIGRAACGALLVHLSVILISLAGTASVRGSTTSDEFGQLTIQTTFAAIEPLLRWSGLVALTAGLTIWALVAIAGLPWSLRRTKRPAAPVEVAAR